MSPRLSTREIAEPDCYPALRRVARELIATNGRTNAQLVGALAGVPSAVAFRALASDDGLVRQDGGVSTTFTCANP